MRKIAVLLLCCLAALLVVSAARLASAEAPPTKPVAKVPAKRARPTKLEEVDALRLMKVQAEARAEEAKRDAARDRFENAQQKLLALQERYNFEVARLKAKYGVDPAAGDDFDPNTYAIKWADEKKAAK